MLDLKRGVFRKTASQRYGIRVAAVLAHWSVILLALAGARVYIHSRARRYIVHMRIFITGRRPRLRAIVRLKVGMTL